MTDYSGTIRGSIILALPDPAVGPNGEVPADHVSNSAHASLTGTLTLTGVTVDAAGTVTGVMTATIIQDIRRHTQEEGTTTRQAIIDIPATPFTTTLADFSLELTALDPAFTIRPTHVSSFSPYRDQLTLAQSAEFTAIDATGPVTGNIGFDVVLIATTSVYRVPGSAYSNLDIFEGPGRKIIIDVTRIGGIAHASAMTWSLEALGTLTDADFPGGVLPTGTLDFAPGDWTKTLSIDIADNANFDQRSRSYRLVVAAAPGEVIRHDEDSPTVVIYNDDPPPVLSITPLDADKPEGDSGTTAFTFLITRTGNTLGTVDAEWSLFHGAAELAPGQAHSGSIHFAAGETEHLLSLDIAGDLTAEPDRGFLVMLDDRETYWRGADSSAGGAVRTDDPVVFGDVAVADAGTGQPRAVTPVYYYGPVSGVEKELILITPDNINVAASGPNWFIHTGSGNDAIAMSSGSNVLDGGTGSNFLTGGSGTDHFFIDARGITQPVWSTVLAMDTDENVTIWIGNVQGVTMTWEDNLGAPGFQGLTLHVGGAGRPWASLTLPGFTKADLDRFWNYDNRVGAWTAYGPQIGGDYIIVNVHEPRY